MEEEAFAEFFILATVLIGNNYQATSLHVCEFLCAKILVFVVLLQILELCHHSKVFQGSLIRDDVLPNVFLTFLAHMVQ